MQTVQDRELFANERARGALEVALEHARTGDVDEALSVLAEVRTQRALTLPELSVAFMLLCKKEAWQDGIAVTVEALAIVKSTLDTSNWTLRRALLALELRRRDDAMVDVLAVLKMKANEGHVLQARDALLRVAALPQGAKKTRPDPTRASKPRRQQ